MTAITAAAVFVGGFVVCFLLVRFFGIGAGKAVEKAAAMATREIHEAAEAEAQEIKKAAAVEGKELAFKIREEAEELTSQRRSELAKQEESIVGKTAELERERKKLKKQTKDLERRERAIGGREKAAESMARKAEEEQARATANLEAIAGLSASEARSRLEQALKQEAQQNIAGQLKAIEDEAREEADAKSKQIIAAAIQRYASEFVAERTVSVIPLPSDDMKGRLIGREGRNIRALEAAAGIDLIIDDTAEVITISCFNPVRREIGRLAITKLTSDGRIHPTRIEEVVAASEREVETVCKEAGEQAIFDLGLHRIHPELVRYLGRLKYRSSYAQNLLAHSVEVGFLAGLMASELGMSVKQARRAGLLHDIGKAVDHEYEGSHGEVGAQLARKHGESPKICQAIAAHHGGDVEPQSVLDHIVQAANMLSSARPGARRELLASYVKRLEDLEQLASKFEGVSKVFAVQAGREVRVMVQNDKVDDVQAHILSKEIAHRIEAESTYPGQVRVVVIRETRASEYAH